MGSVDSIETSRVGHGREGMVSPVHRVGGLIEQQVKDSRSSCLLSVSGLRNAISMLIYGCRSSFVLSSYLPDERCPLDSIKLYVAWI